MRLVTIAKTSHTLAAAVVDDDVVVLSDAAGVLGVDPLPTSVKGILEGGQPLLDRVRHLIDLVRAASDGTVGALRARGAVQALDHVAIAAPIPAPLHVLSCGMNFRKHLEEMGGPMPETPTAFLKSPAAIIGSGSPIVLPSSSPDMVDWEAEFCGVIGRPCHDVSVAEALDFVVGYTMINDVSARNWVRPMGELQGLEATKAWDLNLLGKQFPTFCPMGPSIVTTDELTDPTAVRFELRLNGEVKQSACTDDLAFGLAELVSYYSRWYQFMPGDVISTGSPAGVGMSERPFRFLRPGDVVTITADGVGTMTTPVVAGD